MLTLVHNAALLDHASTKDAVVSLKTTEETSTRRSRKTRGRKLGVRTVSEGLGSHRRAWLFRFTRPRGMNLRLCQLLSAPDSFVSHLLAGRRTFTNNITNRIEEVLGLAHGTIDAGSEFKTVPTTAPSAEEIECVIDARLAQALVNILNRALARGEVNNAVSIKVLLDITAS